MPDNPYQILGVSPGATQEEIKTAYRDLAKQFHPDLNPGNKQAEKRFKDLNAAYELIGSEEARAKFEQSKTQREEMFRNAQAREHYRPFYYETQQQGQGGGRYSRSFDASDVDSDLLEMFFRRQAKGDGAPKEVYELAIELADSVRGVQKELTLPNGKRLSVNIPAGISPGTQLRFAGQGAAGNDVLIKIRILPSEAFRVEGHDIVTDLPLDISDALLGAEIQASTLEGRILLKIPPHVDTGKRIRVPGKGLLDRKSGKRGDFIYRVQLHMPKFVTPELEEGARAQRKRGQEKAS